MPRRKLLPHTADIMAQVCGRGYAGALAQLLPLVRELCGLKKAPQGTAEVYSVSLEAPDQKDLAVAWANELLFLINTRYCYPAAVKRLELTEGGLEADIEVIKARQLPLEREIKAAAYHGAAVEQMRHHTSIKLLFDL